jgi:hypothetical protein
MPLHDLCIVWGRMYHHKTPALINNKNTHKICDREGQIEISMS